MTTEKLIFGKFLAPEEGEPTQNIKPFKFPPILGKEALFLQIMITLRLNASKVRGLKPRPKGKLAQETNSALINAVLTGSSSLFYTLEDGFKYEVPLENLGGSLDSFLSAMSEIETEDGDDDEGDQEEGSNPAPQGQSQDGDSKNQVPLTFVESEHKDAQPAEAPVAEVVLQQSESEQAQEEESEMDRLAREMNA